MARLQSHRDGVVTFGLDAGEVAAQGDPVVRVALVAQDLDRELHVLGGQRRTVGEPRLLAQLETVGVLVGGNAHGAGDEAVERVGLVRRAGHQTVERSGYAGGAVAGQVEDVQRVERQEILVAGRAGDLQLDLAALGCLRIDVGQVIEVLRQAEIAEDREAVGFDVAGIAVLQRGGESGTRECRHQEAGGTQSQGPTPRRPERGEKGKLTIVAHALP